MTSYKLTSGETVLQLNENGTIDAICPGGTGWAEYQIWLEENEVEEADPVEEPGPTRDERLLAAVETAKTVVDTPGLFTAQQSTALKAVFDGLGEAITGS